MSWFDAASLANIAKSALKGAQRTIDKALDITEDSNLVPANTPVDTNSENFFGNWGLAHPDDSKNVKRNEEKPNEKQVISSSLWGSFTGSFFDTSEDNIKSPYDSLEDGVDVHVEHFNQSKLVVQHGNYDSEVISTFEIETKFDKTEENSIEKKELGEINIESTGSYFKRPEKINNSYKNRLPTVSCESGKNSSESVDVITCNTECTSPESDALSLGQSISTPSSALGTRVTSESVEILGDSTSPSSVEVIGTDSTDSRRQSQYTDEFVSPLESPWSDSKSSSVEKISPESVEVIPEDQDENSIAEDTMSYTSISESTSATVLDSAFNLYIKPQKMLKDTFNRSNTMTENSSTDLSLSPDKHFYFSDAITRAPSRSNMHLPLNQVNQLLIDTQPQSNKDSIPNILQKTNIIDIPQDSNITNSCSETYLEGSADDSSQSDKTVIASDNTMETSSDTSTTTETSSHSIYLRNLLADAMTEKNEKSLTVSDTINLTSSADTLGNSLNSQLDMPLRDNSPISSESRSDLVKIGSDYTSGHTSGDEIETTASSDIEIISSPNGDSSSTQSRQSPAKLIYCKGRSDETTIDTLLCKMAMKKVKGHTRELSEASSISDDSHSSEIDRLLKRISEMTDILESRESKLIDINRRNAELQEINNDLKIQLNSIITKQLESADLSQVTEEYTQRLSALEKKFQQAIREKDTLRKQLDHEKQEAASRMSKGELESLLSEKNELIKELREEGEKLSKQQLQHSSIIKKLRHKEKDNEITIKHLKESVEALSSESERLKKSLIAKEEVERSQIEAIHQLSTKNKKLENEIAILKSQLDDYRQKLETTKESLDAAKKELTDKYRANSELLMKEHTIGILENEKKALLSQNEEVRRQLDDLRYNIQQSRIEHIKNEQKLRHQNTELLSRLEEVETKNEELSQSVLEVSKPLIRQLESLQAAHNMKIVAFEKIEEEMTLKIRDLTAKLKTSASAERMAREELLAIKTKLTQAENQISTSNHKLHLLQMKLEQQENEKRLTENELKRKMIQMEDTIKKNNLLLGTKEIQLSTLQQELSSVKTSNTETKQKIDLQQQNQDKENYDESLVLISSRSNSSSPTLSLGKVSFSESMETSFWAQEEPFDSGHAPKYTNMFEMQMLQANLKQREGEVQQLQWEMNRREQERSLLNSEIANLLNKIEVLENKSNNYDLLRKQFEDTQKQYDTLCQLYGEKVEENEELKLDLQDVKEMYKIQIDDLLKQQKQNNK